jgi:hypothetical protein
LKRVVERHAFLTTIRGGVHGEATVYIFVKFSDGLFPHFMKRKHLPEETGMDHLAPSTAGIEAARAGVQPVDHQVRHESQASAISCFSHTTIEGGREMHF